MEVEGRKWWWWLVKREKEERFKKLRHACRKIKKTTQHAQVGGAFPIQAQGNLWIIQFSIRLRVVVGGWRGCGRFLIQSINSNWTFAWTYNWDMICNCIHWTILYVIMYVSTGVLVASAHERGAWGGYMWVLVVVFKFKNQTTDRHRPDQIRPDQTRTTEKSRRRRRGPLGREE